MARRPVWLFSLDSERFAAAPMTTGGLAAYFLKYGRTSRETDLELVHFLEREQIDPWFAGKWERELRARADDALSRGMQPVLGFSFYTWNTAEFLSLIKRLRASCPQALVVAGGPHVQHAEAFLYHDGIDVVVLGEGEATFQELLDCAGRERWPEIPGLAFADRNGEIRRTRPRGRFDQLDRLPSALEIVALRDQKGQPLYEAVAYETSRGCPFSCAFCEWGTSALGTRVHQFSLERIRRDFEAIVAGGIHDIWLCDSNFGALKEDLEKTRLLVELRQRTGLPYTVGTSWAKRHDQRTKQIVLLLYRNGMIQNYNLALQTLTPLALELSHRKNMSADRYRSVAKEMSEAGVPVAAELIWGLPGDNLAEFESNLERLWALFPNINIFGYTLLPGTEFYRRREEYQIETLPVAGYGKAKGEYVIGCHTFSREQGLQGYFLITAHILLIRGYLMPLAARYLALHGGAALSSLLQEVLRALCRELAGALPDLDLTDRMAVYEHRSRLFLAMIERSDRCFEVIRGVAERWLGPRPGAPELWERTSRVLELDQLLCPRAGSAATVRRSFDFPAARVERLLSRMELPPTELFGGPGVALEVRHPGLVGELVMDPDGGSWMRGTIAALTESPEQV